MIEFFNIFLGGIIILFAFIYVFSKISNKKANYKSYVFWMFLILYGLYLGFSYNITLNYIRIILNFVFLTFINYKLFKIEFFKTVIISFFAFVLVTFSEFVFMLLVIIFSNNNVSSIQEQYSGSLIANLSVGIISVCIVNLKSLKILINNYILNIKIYKSRNFFFLIGLAVFNLAISIYYLYFSIPLIITVLINLFIIFLVLILVILIFQEQSKNERLQIEYEVLIDNLNEYEKMLENYRMNNHENNNQLAVIKGMLDNKNNSKKIKEYIDSLVKDKKLDDEELLLKTRNLPQGGLQGLIYQKLLLMKEKQIKIEFKIDKNLDLKIMEKFDIELNKHICTILGVYLDNAIEAVDNLNKKEIGINFYLKDGKILILIANNFQGIIELDKIDNVGYSSKEKGRGYGLSLANKIISSDKNISVEREVIANIFKQMIIIKI